MLELLLSVLAAVRVFFRPRAEASLQVLALRQQVAVLKRQRPRPTLTGLDRVFWTTLTCDSCCDLLVGTGVRRRPKSACNREPWR
jgi:hypothetical protein